MKAIPHLNFGGNCEAAFRFYEQLLHGKLTMIMRVSDLPPDVPRPGGAKDAVIHAHLQAGDLELIGNDVPPEHFQPPRSVYCYLRADSASEVERIHEALAERGQVTMKLQETFFASRFSQLRDRFGTLWTLIHERKP